MKTELYKYQHYKPDDIFDNNVKKFRLEFGLSLKELTQLCDIPKHIAVSLDLGLHSPFNRYGELYPCIEKMCDLFDCELSDLFPRDICDIDRKSLEFISLDDVDENNEIFGFDAHTEVENSIFLNELFSKFLKDNQNVFNIYKHFEITIKFYYNDFDKEELSRIYGVTTTRIDQIINKHIKKVKKWMQEN